MKTADLPTFKSVIKLGEKRLRENLRTKKWDAEQCARLVDLIDEMKKMDAELDALKKEHSDIPG